MNQAKSKVIELISGIRNHELAVDLSKTSGNLAIIGGTALIFTGYGALMGIGVIAGGVVTNIGAMIGDHIRNSSFLSDLKEIIH